MEENKVEEAVEEQQEEKQEVEVQNELEVEVVDDTPPEDKGKKPLEKDPEPTQEELNDYSESVQKRIKELTHARHDERRAKEKLERERDELLELSQKLLKEKQNIQKEYYQGEEYAVNQFKEKADLALDNAKRLYKEAYDAGDASAMADAQALMSKATLEKTQLESFKPRKVEEDEKKYDNIKTEKKEELPKVVPDQEALDWADKNSWWFGPEKDTRMTGFAYGVHDELIKKGIDPRVEPETYYTAIDRAMRETFPRQFEEHEGVKPQAQPKKKTPVVAPVTRTANGKAKVVLSSTQERIARKLGISKEQYARELVKLETQNG